MENVSKLIAYSERSGEEALSRHAKKRAQRTMHYNVSFRPFMATIEQVGIASGNECDGDSLSSESLNSSSSIFMRTPTSFPPTPTSRMFVHERGSRFTENIMFLARDQLRVERGMGNRNQQTREMSKALIEGSRLAVFDATDVGNGIALSCGQHIATKVGNAVYCSARSMVPVMRNSYVYFEISTSPVPRAPRADGTTLAIGLSTTDLPLDALVGAGPSSVGLCSAGQVLRAGHWLLPAPGQGSFYGSDATVGCLVYLDDAAAHAAAEGPCVAADVTFNVDGRVVPPCPNGGVGTGSGSRRTAHTLSLSVDQSRELFPTVTLHSPATCVMCRFSADDVLARSRADIGALSGATVYAVDGSVVFEADEEGQFSDGFVRHHQNVVI